MYQSLIYPYLTYGLAAWGQAYKNYLNKILKLQKRALHTCMMCFTDRCDHAILFFIDANTLPITFLYYVSVSNLMHDINSNNAPLNIVHLFEKTSSIHSYYTRSTTSRKVYVKSFRLEIQKHSFSRLGVKLWNEIPSYITDLSKKAFQMVLCR